MHSNLTRQIFRQILRNKPLSHLQCSGESALRPYRCRCSTAELSRTTRRSIFGFSRKIPQEPKPTDLAPGFQQLLELNNALAVKARPPPATSIAKAFLELFKGTHSDRLLPTEFHAEHAIIAFKYLQVEHAQVEDFGLSTDDLVSVLYLFYRNRFVISPRGHRSQLARLVFEELSRRRTHNPELVPEYARAVLVRYLLILTACHDSLKARQLVEQYMESGSKDDTTEAQTRLLDTWKWILNGLVKENNAEEVSRTIEIMRAHGIPFDTSAQKAIVQASVQQNDLASAKKWYRVAIDGGQQPDKEVNRDVLKLCISHKDLEWGQEICAKILEQMPDKDCWDIIFQWAAVKGKGVDEVERMMKVMVERSSKNGNNMEPDIDTINSLVRLANDSNDPYTAERYIGLANSWGIQLNAQTYLYQLDYRLKVGDISGALHAYTQLQSHEVLNPDFAPRVNKLVSAVCNSKGINHETIMALVEDMKERGARFEPEAVAALCLIHLKRNELHDVIDLLQTHAFHFERDERALVRDSLVGFALDRANNTAIAWDSYTILRQLFDETDRGLRTKLMNEFFGRNRSDMAIHVFGHMRQSPLDDKRPTSDTYTQCFEGLGKVADRSSLETVHNMLKLDPEVEPDTKLYNALMLAYSACNLPDRSLEFWDSIVYSREGPTYNSICIALRACELMPFGEQRARDIWERLRRFGIDITKEIYAAYVAALAGNGLTQEAMEQLGKMEIDIGSPPDTIT